jgi:hypothetical protein
MTDEVTRLLTSARPAQFRPGTPVSTAIRERELADAFTARSTAHHVPGARMQTAVRHTVSAVRPRRRRRGAWLAASGLAVAVGLALGLGLSSAGVGKSAPTAVQDGPKLAAWTVRTSPDGIVTLTLRQFTNAPALQHVLAAHGVPAIVHAGDSICGASDGSPLPGLFKVVTQPRKQRPGSIVTQIRPAAMPSGSELLFSLTSVSGVVQYVNMELIRAGTAVSCQRPPPVKGQ